MWSQDRKSGYLRPVLEGKDLNGYYEHDKNFKQ